MRAFELKISTELNLETAKHTYFMMVIFCVHFHRANQQNLTTNGNNGTSGPEHLDLSFYLGIYAGNCTYTCVCLRTIYYLIESFERCKAVCGEM